MTSLPIFLLHCTRHMAHNNTFNHNGIVNGSLDAITIQLLCMKLGLFPVENATVWVFKVTSLLTCPRLWCAPSPGQTERPSEFSSSLKSVNNNGEKKRDSKREEETETEGMEIDKGCLCLGGTLISHKVPPPLLLGKRGNNGQHQYLQLGAGGNGREWYR